MADLSSGLFRIAASALRHGVTVGSLFATRGSVVVLSFLILIAQPAAGQEPPAPVADSAAMAGQEGVAGDALRVFLDCQGRYCDSEFFRREITFVNYTRFREESQVHLLITSQSTGGRGNLFTMDFIGQGNFEGIDDQLETSTRANLAEAEVLLAMTQTIKLGLMRYVARTPFADRVDIGYEESTGQAGAVAQPEDDPWDFWVFRIRGSLGFEGEDRQKDLSTSGGLYAYRVTEDLKLTFSLSGRYSRSEFEIDSTETVTSIRRNWDAYTQAVWSLGGHWSAGGEASVTHSLYSNEDLVARLAPAIEYNIFPYEESNRRILLIKGTVGINHFNWIEETIYFKTEETKFDTRVSISLDVKEPWGSAGAGAEMVVFLDDPAQNRLIFRGGIGVRLFKGLSLELSGDLQRVRDQFNLPAGEASRDDILLRQRELLTGFEFELDFGFSYTFGSIFSNVVNPRFGGGHRRF
jgi:hypothetical protein